MYRHCIFCAGALGANDSIEEFPVGRALAFDAWRGRLWAICPSCHRWNLAPIETRWEAVERAEGIFRDTALKVQAERIGLAQLRDGTRLVRVGDAVPGELAAWRYGRELRARRWRHWMDVGFGVLTAVVVGWPAFLSQYRRKEVIGRVPAADSPNGRELLIRRYHLDGAEFRRGGGAGDEGVALHLPRRGRVLRRFPELELRGRSARALLERSLVGINQRGASPRSLEGALGLLERAGSAEAYVGGVTSLRIRERLRSGYWRCEWGVVEGAGGAGGAGGLGASGRSGEVPRTRVGAPQLLALEMALHEAAERRALAGELAELEVRWREAEEIARIADAL
jgi:hypothetical protein